MQHLQLLPGNLDVRGGLSVAELPHCDQVVYLILQALYLFRDMLLAQNGEDVPLLHHVAHHDIDCFQIAVHGKGKSLRIGNHLTVIGRQLIDIPCPGRGYVHLYIHRFQEFWRLHGRILLCSASGQPYGEEQCRQQCRFSLHPTFFLTNRFVFMPPPFPCGAGLVPRYMNP